MDGLEKMTRKEAIATAKALDMREPTPRETRMFGKRSGVRTILGADRKKGHVVVGWVELVDEERVICTTTVAVEDL